MTEEQRANARERMRRYRARHKDDPEYKARVKAEKKRQWAKNPEKRREIARRGTKRYRDKKKHNLEFRAKAAAATAEWRKKNLGRAKASVKEWAEKNPEKVKAASEKYRERNPNAEMLRYRADPVRGRAIAAARRSRKRQAMPSWADQVQIEAFYAEARKRTEETGIIWHVDHIVPLKHKLVCGLHVPANLQVITQSENCSKHNRFACQ